MFHPQITTRMRARRLKRIKALLLMVACLLLTLSASEQSHLRGRYFGSKNIARTRKEVSALFEELGCYQERAYRMNPEQFLDLHRQLYPQLEKQFPTNRKRGTTPNGSIETKLRLSAALRFFAGASPLDIMLTHGMSRQSVYNSIWGTTDAINETPTLSFNNHQAEFPSHAEQEEIARGFKARSTAEFDKVCLAVDGMLIWTEQPSRADCEELQIGERQFHCWRKDKFGMVLMAGCDSMCRFRWADIRHPGKASDYLAFATSDLGIKLEKDNNGIIKPGYTMIGDNAWVPRPWMATPIPGNEITATDDAYNFYHSQLRITIERCFGIFVHRWGVLRRPLSVSILKVPALIMCLMKLHNFCINNKSYCTPATLEVDEHRIRRVASTRGNTVTNRHASGNRLNSRGLPDELLGSGHHFRDLPRNRRPVFADEEEAIPMEKMRKIVAEKNLKRPTVNKYAGRKRKAHS